MHIETIDLRLPSKIPRWIWYLNGLLLGALLLMLFMPDVLRTPAADAVDIPKPIAATSAVSAASQAVPMDAQPQALDWDAVLTGLEKNQATGAAMEGFSIDATNRSMRLTLSFDTYEHLAQYMDSPHLKSTQLPCRLESAEVLADMGSAGLPGKAVVSCGQ
jgi:hypothetical protein